MGTLTVGAAASGSRAMAGHRSVHSLLAGASIILLALVAHVALRLTGGSPNSLNHLGYAPVVLAGYLFGWRGGLLSAAFVAALLGPLAELTGVPTDGPRAWLIRGVAFVGLGLLVGVLFDRSRVHAERWQATAVRVAERERDGMVALARGAEAKDTDTGEHIRRVQLVSEELALAAGLDRTQAAAIGWAAMLHDVGKLHVPDRILLKPGPLDADEWTIMRQHPIWGEQILADGDGFALARRIARWHHENIDGTGYPDGLAGGSIPLEARIVRITDSFDAMTNRRPYSQPRGVDAALEELERCAGTQFDPELVRLMIALIEADSDLRARLAQLGPRASFVAA